MSARLGYDWLGQFKIEKLCYAEFPAVSLLFRSRWVVGGRLVAGEVGTKTNLSPSGANLLGLSLATSTL